MMSERKVALITGVTGQDGLTYQIYYWKKGTKYMDLKEGVLSLIPRE